MGDALSLDKSVRGFRTVVNRQGIISPVKIPALAGTHEIAVLLGVSRQRVLQLAQSPGFPAPVAKLKVGNVWVKGDIERWAQAHGRLPGDK